MGPIRERNPTASTTLAVGTVALERDEFARLGQLRWSNLVGRDSDAAVSRWRVNGDTTGDWFGGVETGEGGLGDPGPSTAVQL
jgi:hypothetical protein